MEKLFAMKRNKKILAFYLLTLSPLTLFAEEEQSSNWKTTAEKVQFSGYLSGIHNSIYLFGINDYSHTEMLHNRLNFRYNPSEKWTFVSEIRTRGIYYSEAKSTLG
jgi:hypothetical protein